MKVLYSKKIVGSLLGLWLFFLGEGSVYAQLSIDDVNGSFLIDFENTVNGVNNGTFSGMGVNPNPIIGQLDSDAWAFNGFSDGGLNFGSSGLSGDYLRGSSAGGITVGGLYSFEISSGDFALGFQSTDGDMTPGTITLRIQNNTLETINGLSISYNLFFFDDGDRSSSIQFSHSADDLSYTSEMTLDQSTPLGISSLFWSQTSQGIDLSGLDIAPGDFYFFRWSFDDDLGTGSRDEIAINNIQISNIASIQFNTGDWRPATGGIGLNDTNWERFDGVNWTATGISPEAQAIKPDRLVINQVSIFGSNSAETSYNDIVITSGGSLHILQDLTNPTDNFITASRSLVIKSGGQLLVQGDIQFDPAATIIAEEGSEIILDQVGIDNTHPFWNGIERFESGSTLIINDWNWFAASADRSLIGSSPQISNNSNGYKFGAIHFQANPLQDFVIVDGAQGSLGNPFLLCENNLEITNSNGTQLVSITDASSNSFFRLNGSLLLNSGKFAFTNTNAAVNHEFEILGSLTTALNSNILSFGNSANSSTEVRVALDASVDLLSGIESLNPLNSLRFNGNTTQRLAIFPNLSNLQLEIGPGANVELNRHDLTFAGDVSLTVENGAVFSFSFNGLTPLVIQETSGSNNAFTSETGSTIKISSPAGILSSGDCNLVGIPMTNRSISKTATFHYIGRADQVTGDAVGTGFTDKNIIVELSSNRVLTPSGDIGIVAPGNLEIIGGTFSIPDGTELSGSGNIIMSGGELQLANLAAASLPALTGAYTLTGGSIHLNGGGDQVLRGSRDYFSLGFSNSGNKTLSSALTNIDGQVLIENDAILDTENNSFAGTGSLRMEDNAQFRMSRLNETLPQLEGAYQLNGGTIELYGTSATQSHSIRGGRSYFSLRFSADGANEETGEANVIAQSSFVVKNALDVNAPATFQISNNFVVSGTGTFNLNAGAGIKYGNAVGLRATDNSGNIQTSVRNYASGADYYLVGPNNQVTGDGLPSQVRKLVLDKTAGQTDLSANLSVSEELRIINQDLNLNGQDITLLNPAFLTEDRANGHLVVDISALDGGPGRIFAQGRTYDETSINADIAGLGLQLQSAPGSGTVTVDVERGHRRVGSGVKGIRKYFIINNPVGTVTGTTLRFYYADDDFISITDLIGEEDNFTLSRFETGWEDGLGAVNTALNYVEYGGVNNFSTWTITSFNIPLPFEFLHLEAASLGDQKVRLNWTDRNAGSLTLYKVQKSRDGQSFEDLWSFKVDQSQNTAPLLSFLDDDFQSSAYYRITAEDELARIRASNIVFLENSQALVLKVYPNPVIDRLHIQPSQAAPLRVSLFNSQGMLLFDQIDDSDQQEKALNALLATMPRGTYMIQLQQGTLIKREKLIKR